MDLGAIGSRIRTARERKHMTQGELAEIVDLSTNHISVIERGVKPPKLDTFVNIANALEVSADTLLQDVVKHSAEGVSNEFVAEIMKLHEKERSRIINAVHQQSLTAINRGSWYTGSPFAGMLVVILFIVWVLYKMGCLRHD